MSDPKAAFWLLLSSIAWPTAEATAQTDETRGPDQTVAVSPGERLEIAPPDGSSSVFAWTDDASSAQWREGTEAVAPSSEGTYWLALRSRDDVGQLSDIAWYAVRVDETGPSVSIELGERPDSSWWGPGATATCRAEDPSKIASRRWTRPGPTDAAAPLRFSAGGLLTLACEATDEVGNSGRGERLVPVDLEPPHLALQLEDGMPLRTTDDGRWLLRQTRIHATVRDAASGVASSSLTVDGRAVTGPWQPTPGDHVLELTATDHLGQSATLRVAATAVPGPPSLDVTVSAAGAERDGTTYYQGPVTVEAGTDDGAELHWSHDGATWLDGAGSVLTEEGWIAFRATDRAGARVYRQVELPRDHAGPTAVLETADGRTWSPHQRIAVDAGEAIEVRVADEGVGTSSYRIAHRRPGLPRFAAPVTGDSDGAAELTLAPGRHLLRVVAEDALGNRSDFRWHLHVGSDR